jgi:type I restriction enzyme, S subunit
MDAQQFLAEFGHITNAPGGVARLRELIFSLASDGKLIANCEDVGLSHLGRVADFVMGQAPPGNECNTRGDGTVFVKTGEFGDLHPVVREWTTKPLKFAKEGDVLICVVGATVGKLNLAIDCAIGRSVAAIRPHSGLGTKYLYFMLTPFTLRLRSGSRGSAQGVIGKAELSSITLRVPSEDEQTRIVAKVDELMALCDKLEEQQQSRRKLQNALRQSTLQALANAQSPHELQACWARLEANFGRLFSAPEDVEVFKGLAIDLAVNGRLLPPGQRVASTGQEVIEAVTAERNIWAKKANGQEQKEAAGMLKKLRSQRLQPPSEPLPEHWCWATLLQVSQAVVDCHNKTAPYVPEGIHLVRTTDIRNGRMDLTKTRKISKETYEYWARRMPPCAGDIFFTREAPMGEAAIVPDGEKVCLGQRTMLIRLFNRHFSNRFLLYAIMSPNFQARMIEAAIGMTVKHLRVGGVEDLVVPVPPKREQDQIVEAIDRLFEICERYKQHLEKRLSLSASLATNAVSQLTGISIQEEDEPVKVPQTELIAKLRLGQAPSVKTQAPLATILARQNGELSAQDLWQRFGGEIDAFYAQLKAEVGHGWIEEPAVAEMREKPAERVVA